MTNATAAVNALMLDYAWAVHDFQQLARSLSLLASAIGADDFEDRNFYADVELLTMDMAPETARHAAVVRGLTADDKAVLVRLKQARDKLVYSFFLDCRLDRPGANDMVAQAQARLTAIRDDVKKGHAVLDRAYALVAEAGEDD